MDKKITTYFSKELIFLIFPDFEDWIASAS